MKNIATNNIVTKLMVVLMGLFISSSVLAQNGNVREETARQVGLNFLRLKDGNPRSDLQLTRVDAVQYPNLYVYNTSENGFIVVASDNRMEPILAYSDEGTFDKDNVAPGANFWFEMYEYAIDSIVRNNVRDVDENITRKWEDLENGVMPEPERSEEMPYSKGPLIGTHWGQDYPFNEKCPTTTAGEHAATGCVATALAQVLYYFKVSIPQRTIWYAFRHKGSEVLNLNGFNQNMQPVNTQSVLENGCVLPIRKKYSFGGWDSYGANNTTIAKMMLDCGLAADMIYSVSESSAWSICSDACPNESSAEKALKEYFQINAEGFRRNEFSRSNWIVLLTENLINNNPIIYSGGGHTFICDGYDGYGYCFHFNFGWDGDGDGYYYCDNPNGWQSNQDVVITNPTNIVVWNDEISMGELALGQCYERNWCQGVVELCRGNNAVTQGNRIEYNGPGHYCLRNRCASENKTLIWNVNVKYTNINRDDHVCRKGEYHRVFDDFYDNNNQHLNWTAEFNLSREQTDFSGAPRYFTAPILDNDKNIVGTCRLELRTVGVVEEHPKQESYDYCYFRNNLGGTYEWDVFDDGTKIIPCKGSGHYEHVVPSSTQGGCETLYTLDLEILMPPIEQETITVCTNTYSYTWNHPYDPSTPSTIHELDVPLHDYDYHTDEQCSNDGSVVYALTFNYRAMDTIEEEKTKCIKDLPFEYRGELIGSEITQRGWYSYQVNEPKDPNDPAQCDKVYLLLLTVTEDCCTTDPECIKDKITGGNKSTPSNMETIYYGLKHYYEYRDATNDFLFNVFNGISWPSMEERNTFWNLFQSLLDSNTGMMSEEAMQQLIATNPYDYITEEYITDLVERYNRSAMYWNEGLYSIWHLPQGYDLDFIEYDTAAMNKAYEAYDYAIAHGFSDVRAMYDNAYELLAAEVDNIQSSVCARVTVQFTQKMTMTREAFNGTLQIFNGHESIPMQNILVDFMIKDAQGNNCTDLFQINTLSLDQITGISGDGSLAAQTNGTALVQFIPTKNAAPTQPVVYSFGGSFSFIDPFTGEGLTYPLYPVDITVNPSPDLYVDYFMQRDILGDDALTLDVVEPSIPAELGVIINNKGAGMAKNVLLETAEPQIIDNEKGLAIDFAMYGALFNGSPRQLGLTEIRFGNIESGQTAVGEWLFTSSLLGHFISYDAHVIHNSSYGNQDLSLVSHLDIHELVHPIYAYGNLDDGINDFLVNDNPDAYDTPDSIYFSHGGKTSVGVVDGINFDHYVSSSDTIVTITVVPSRIGWNYGVTDDPGMNQYDIVSCIRNNDNQEIPLNNVWQTFVTIPDGGDPVYENKLHIVDTLPVAQTTTYTLVYTKSTSQNNNMTQSMTLKEGWNWWSSYIDLSNDGLERLEAALSENGVCIKSQYNGLVMNSSGNWNGSLAGLNNEYMYLIQMDETDVVAMNGVRINPTHVNLSIQPGWNWIGYPITLPLNMETAFSNYEATVNDIIKGKEAFAIYYENYGWIPNTFVLTPGQGYMYKSLNTTAQTLTFADGRSGFVSMVEEPTYWQTNVHAFAYNLNIVAIVMNDGEELRKEGVELGAFVNDECRGSAKLYYVEPINRYIAFLTVTGKDGEQIEFRLINHNSEFEAKKSCNYIDFQKDAVFGTLDQPFPIRFGAMNELTEIQMTVSVYPNPVDRNTAFTLEIPEGETVTEVLVVNAMGETVLHETDKLTHTLYGLSNTGVYMVKAICKSGNVYISRVVVK